MKRAIPLLLLLLSLTLQAAAQTQEAPSPPADNPEIEKLFQEDQADRKQSPIDWSVVEPRDAARRVRVRQILDAGQARTARDYYHAAMVFQHGEGAEDIKTAWDLARRAVELDPDLLSAKRMTAMAHDRYLHRTGKPQIYGTQLLRPPGTDRWTLEPFDPTAVTDEQRKALGVRTVEEAIKWRDEMNRALEAQMEQKPAAVPPA